jgi:phosphatidate phosphatase APP1
VSKLKRRLFRAAADIEKNFDELAHEFRVRMNADDVLQIIAYRTYGTARRLYIKGRVLKDKGIIKPTDKDTVLRNLISMYKRFTTNEVPNARLQVIFQGRKHFAVTDDEGYFTMELASHRLELQDLWYALDVELIDAPYSFTKNIRSTASILIPPTDAEFGVISDIDDTIVKTSANDLLSMARITFLNNAITRLPFAGVAEFYNALQLGRNGRRNNPFFYVSSSPWNLYDLLIDFLDLNNIPEGPLLLRDYGLDEKPEDDNHSSHKIKEITNILRTYPELKFVLIGDSGQEDPNIYSEIVGLFPERILAIYIRDVQLPEREKVAINVAKGVLKHKVEMLIVDNTVEAAKHAAGIGLIESETVPRIEHDKSKDKGESPGKEKLDW